MAVATPRWVLSARRRPAAFVAVLLLSAGGVLVSSLTPMLVGALDTATLREQAAAATMPRGGIAATAVSDSEEDVPDAEQAVSNVLLTATGTGDRWGEPRTVLEAVVAAHLTGPRGGQPVTTGIAIAEGGCAGIAFTGRCPGTATEALVPATVAERTGWRVGTRLSTPVPTGSAPLTIAVVGVFRADRGRGLVLGDPIQLSETSALRAVPNLVVGQTGERVLASQFRVSGAVRLARPVRPQDVAPLRKAVLAARAEALELDEATFTTSVRTEVPQLLEGIARQQAAAAVLAAPIGLEAVVLAWFALGAVAQRTARSRAAEWGLVRMRGARLRAWTGSVLLEPVIAILAGAAIGLLGGVLLARAVATALVGTADGVAPLSGAVR